MPPDGPEELPGSVHEGVPQFVAVVLPQLLLVRVVGLHVEDAHFLFLYDFDPCKFWLIAGQLGQPEDQAEGVAFL